MKKTPLRSRSRPNRDGAWGPARAGSFAPGDATAWSTLATTFDGVDDYLELGGQGGALRLSGSNGTVSVWIKMDDVSAGDSAKRIVDKSDGGGGANGYCLIVQPDGSVEGFIDGSKTVETSAGSITDATWHFVAWTWNGTNHIIYVDGSLDTTAADTSRPPSDTTGMRIGTWNHSTGREFQGLMDEVSLWSTALSAANIAGIYNNGKPRDLAYLNPVGWWRMGDDDGGAGTTITDQGSGGNNGTLTNGPTFTLDTPQL